MQGARRNVKLSCFGSVPFSQKWPTVSGIDLGEDSVNVDPLATPQQQAFERGAVELMKQPAVKAAMAEVAMVAAWHTAAVSRIAARFLFGMSEGIATSLSCTPLWQLRRIAIDCAGLLTPRWPSNPAFWPDLIRFATTGNQAKLEAARLLGTQLIAAELEGHSSYAPRSRASARRKLSLPAD